MTLNMCQYKFYKQIDAGIMERSIRENSAEATKVGALIAAEDSDNGQSLQYSIIAGNDFNTFRIVACNGQIEVNKANLNFEVQSHFDLQVQVMDNGLNPPSLSATVNVRINVLDVNDPPTIEDQYFSVREGSANGTFIGNPFMTIDEDASDTYTFMLLNDDDGRFKLHNGVNGTSLVIAGDGEIDYETRTQHSIIVEVTDDGNLPASISSQAEFTIEVLDVNEPPTFMNTIVTISENINDGEIIRSTLDLVDEDIGKASFIRG